MKSFVSQGSALSIALLSLSSFTSARSLPRQAAAPSGYAGSGSSFNMPVNGTTNSTSVGNGTTGADTPTLLPAVHWEYPVDDIRNLAPINSTDLYYSANGVSDPSVQHLFASLSTTLQYDAVVLDHSPYVRNISCDADGIHVDFTGPDAFHFAANSWPDVQDFVLVTYTDGCGASTTQRTFWLIDDITPLNSTNSILAVVRNEIAIEDAFNDVEIVWGTYHPSGSDNSTTITSGAPSSTNGNACGSAPSSTVDGFPAADCGAQDFDKKLDEALGYINLANDSSSFLPNVNLDGQTPAAAGLRRRGLLSGLKSIASSIENGVKHAGESAVNAIKNGTSEVVDKGKSIISSLENPSITKSADINAFAPADGSAPWPNAALVFSDKANKGNVSGSIDVYCVGCGVKGHVTVAGSAKWGLTHGLEQLNAQISANIQAGLSLGIDAKAGYSNKQSKTLLNQAIPDLGFSVDKVFSAGVFVTVDATATLDIDAEAQILAGVTMKLPNFQADLNILNEDAAKSSNVTGATPEWDKNFDVKGSVTATAILALPVGLNLGIQIVPLKFDKSVALIEQPNLTGKITAAGSLGDGGPASQTCNDGVEYEITAGNDVSLNLFNIKTFSLEHYVSPPLVQGCFQLPGANKTKTSSATLSPTSASHVSFSNHTTAGATPTAGLKNHTTLAFQTGHSTAHIIGTAPIVKPTGHVSNNTSARPAASSSPFAIPSYGSGLNATSAVPVKATSTSVLAHSSSLEIPSYGSEVSSAASASRTSTVDSSANATTKATSSDKIPSYGEPTPSAASSTTTKASTSEIIPGYGSTPKASTTSEIIPGYGATTPAAISSSSAKESSSTTITSSSSTSTKVTSTHTSSTTSSTSSSAAAHTSASVPSYGTPSTYGSEPATYKKRDNTSSDDDVSYTAIKEIHNAFNLIPGSDGNIYTQSANNGSSSSNSSSANVWATYQNVVVGDKQDRLLYYYPDVMGQYNVSRIRLGTGSQIPKTAQVITFAQDSDVQNAHFAASTKGDTFGLAKCDFSNGADSKVFVAQGQDALDTLKSEKLRYVVTGAAVSSCQWLALVTGTA